MILEKSVELLQDFARQKNNPAFIEFVNNLALFINKYKRTYDVNDFDTFVKVISQNIDKNDENSKDMAISSIYFAKEISDNGNIDYEKFFNVFNDRKLARDEYTDIEEQKQDTNQALKSSLKNFEQGVANRYELSIIIKAYNQYLQQLIVENTLDQNTRDIIQKTQEFVENGVYKKFNDKELNSFAKDIMEYYKNTLKIINNQQDSMWRPADLEQRAGRAIRQNNISVEEDKENSSGNVYENTNNKEQLIENVENELKELENLTQEKNEKKVEITRLEQLKNDEEFFNPNDFKKEIEKEFQKANVQSMLDFIRDKEQINFPFAKKDTLDNIRFKKSFFKELKSLPPQEIQKLIDEVRAKNQALRTEIADLDNKKASLMKDLQSELIDNYKLSEFKEINESQHEQKFVKDNNKDILSNKNRKQG